MDDLFFPVGVDAVHFDPPLLHDIEAAGGLAFAEKVVVFLEVLRERKGGDGVDVAGGQTGEELATAKRVRRHRLPELVPIQRHRATLTQNFISGRRKCAAQSSISRSFGMSATPHTAAATSQTSAA